MKDLRRLQRLLPYLARDQRRLFLAISLLLPVAAASAVQPLLVGQAISVLRGEQAWWWLQAMPMASALRAGLRPLALLAATTRPVHRATRKLLGPPIVVAQHWRRPLVKEGLWQEIICVDPGPGMATGVAAYANPSLIIRIICCNGIY